MAKSSNQTADAQQMRALTVALEMLRKGIADLPLANLATAVEHWDETQQRTVLQTKGGTDWDEMARRAELQAVRDMKRRAAEDKELAESKKPINFAEEFRKQTLSAIRDAKQRKTEDRELIQAQGSFGDRTKLAAEDGMKGFLTMFAGKFAAVLGPLAVFGQILQSNNSGFQLVGTGVKLVAATLAPFLLPAFVMLGGLLYRVSEILENRTASSLQRWYKFMVDDVLPEVEAFARGLEVLADMASDAAAGLQEIVDYAADLVGMGDTSGAAGVGGVGAMIGNAVTNALNGGWSAGAGGSFDDIGGDYGPPGEAKGSGDAAGGGAGGVAKGMEVMLQELKRSLGPQASFTGLAAASRSAQLAALNGSPIDKMILDKTVKSVELLEGILRNTGRAANPLTS